MGPIIVNYLSKLQLGRLQTFNNMGIVPLFTSINGAPEYISLKEALNENLIAIGEVSRSGSVPELKVVNTSSLSVLLLDGEELAGAKQNRVLNTSILLEGNSEAIIPVSCTEHGRWSYTSATFSDTDFVMSHRLRSEKSRAVTGSLHTGRRYSSDQLHVWAGIERMHRQTGTRSATGALGDVYATKAQELDEYLQAFAYVTRQRGSLVSINGQFVGLDVISRETVYETLHPKLVKSYAMDALVQKKERFDEPSAAKAKTFLQEMWGCKESRFDSPGQGYDYRFEGPRVVGSALVLAQKVIHLAFFRLAESEKGGRVSGYMQRRHFRRRRS
jgi:hypothetical protein